MKLIVGLGNPGKEYSQTRHNIGFFMLDEFCDTNNIGSRKTEKTFNAEIIKHGEIIFCKPLTYMNKSGESVKKIIDFYKIDPKDILVLHDEIDLPAGNIQKKVGGSHAGHNGIKSILQHLQNNNIFTRIRIGVDRPTTREEVVDYVLGVFSNKELEVISGEKDIIFGLINDFIEN